MQCDFIIFSFAKQFIMQKKVYRTYQSELHEREPANQAAQQHFPQPPSLTQKSRCRVRCKKGQITKKKLTSSRPDDIASIKGHSVASFSSQYTVGHSSSPTARAFQNSHRRCNSKQNHNPPRRRNRLRRSSGGYRPVCN